MRRIILIVLAILIVASIVFATVVAPRVLRARVIALVEENCETCTFTLGRVGISFLPPVSVSFDVPHLAWGDPQITRVDAKANRVTARISLPNLVRRQINSGLIEIDAPDVVVTEGDVPSTPLEPRKASAPSKWTYVSRAVKVRSGTFRYIRLYEPQNAIIRVVDIEGDVGPCGTTANLRTKDTLGHAEGRLEGTGRFAVSIAMPVLTRPWQVDVDVEIHDQNLADLNAFFEFDSGIRLKGTLVQGRSLSSIRAGRLKGSVEAKYLGLDIDFKRTKERGAIVAFFSNLIQSVTIDPSSIGEKPSDRIRSVDIERAPRESIVLFILRGMKEAALNVASST